jgi:hypothetical protein
VAAGARSPGSPFLAEQNRPYRRIRLYGSSARLRHHGVADLDAAVQRGCSNSPRLQGSGTEKVATQAFVRSKMHWGRPLVSCEPFAGWHV